MKLSTKKPISSPGRTDKFPPPLMRFLRSNAGSRSRGRSSRSSTTIFPRKKNTTTIETQEPSSPKVTCMGQVRVTRSSKQPAAKRVRASAISAVEDGFPAKSRRWWHLNLLFCHRFRAKIKPGSSCCHCHCQCQSVRPNWGLFFRRKASKVSEDSTKKELNFRGRPNNYYDESEEEKTEHGEERVSGGRTSVSISSCSTPPRNSLLLTRCRSAPYSSSSLASRFWGSPLRNEETGEEQGIEFENGESSENERPHWERDCVLEQEERKDSLFQQKLRFFKELEDSLRESLMESENVRALKRREEGDSAARPVTLTRCKSEPARRTAQKLDPEVVHFYPSIGCYCIQLSL